MESKSKTQTSASRFRSPTILVPFAGLVFVDLIFLTYMLLFVATLGTLPIFAIIWIPFIIVNLAAAVGIWRRSRAGYIAAAAVSAVALALFGDGGHGVEIFATPANTLEFIAVILLLPSYLAVLLYSVLGLLGVWRRVPAEIAKPVRTIPWSSVTALLIVGFIAGGLVIGLASGATMSRILAGTSSADITIVLGAASENNAQFYSPASFQAKVGQTVSWVNRDNSAHTVTSDTNAFDSGNMDLGAPYKFTFTQPGTYTYHCTIHPWMKGTVTVTG